MNDPSAALAQPSNQRALRAIACDLLGQETGSRLATGSQYQERLGVGAGTVQKSLRALTTSGAVVLKARGHQGTYVVERDVASLWQIAGLGSVRVLLTPPGATEHYGLVAGLRSAFKTLGVPLEIAYLRGARRRVREMLEGNAAFTVVSGGAVRDLDDANLSAVEIGPDSYYRPDSIVVVARDEPESSEPLRVGIDRSSYDHARLTYAEFPDDGRHTYVDCDFPHVPAALLENRIDAGIWHRMELLIPLHLVGLVTRPLRQAEASTVRSEVSSAVLLADADQPQFVAVLRELDAGTIRAKQEDVLAADTDGELGAYRWTL